MVACSDSAGYVVDEKGIDLDAAQGASRRSSAARISDYAERRGAGATFVAGGAIWDVPCEVAMPCATQNELDGDAAAHAGPATAAASSAEGANMPTHPGGGAGLPRGGRRLRAGQGGQRRRRGHQRAGDAAERLARLLDFEHTEARLAEIMRGIHDRCAETAEEYGAPGDYVLGANIAGFLEVAAGGARARTDLSARSRPPKR